MNADGDGPSAGPIAAIGSLARLGGGLPRALEDLRSIAEGMRILPELSATLAAIEKRVDSLDGEVAKMRHAVESMNVGVGVMQQGVDQLEPHLADMRESLRPLRRAAGRLGGITRRRNDSGEATGQGPQ